MKKQVVKFTIFVAGVLLLGGCYASSSITKYGSEEARAIIDAGNNICITIFLSALARAVFNK